MKLVRFAGRSLRLVPAALLLLAAPLLAKDEGKGAAASKPLRIAVLPIMNRSAEALGGETVIQVLRDELKSMPASKGTFLYPDDVMRLLDQRGEGDRAHRFTERWAKDGGVDSTALHGLDSLLTAEAVLCVKITEFEVKRITKIGLGESSTTIGLQFALFDIKEKKRLWAKEVREQRAAPPIEEGSGSVGYDETGTIESRTANQPPRAKDVADDLIHGAFKNFPKK